MDVSIESSDETSDETSPSDESSSPAQTNESDISNDEIAVKRWEFIKEFKTQVEVDAFLKTKGEFAIRSSTQLNRGLKKTYRCKKAKKLGEQCACKYYTLTGHKRCESSEESDDNDDLQKAGTSCDDIPQEEEQPGPVELYFNNLAHTCDKLEQTSIQLPQKIKEKILSLYTRFRKPKQICLEMSVSEDVADDELPTLRQIRNVLKQHKEKEHGKGPITMRQLNDFVEARSAIPEDEDEAYVVLFERSPSNVEPANSFYRLFLSTKRLLRESADAKNVHADATKKITTDNNPLLVIGTTDAAKKFHLIGFTITSHETGAAYEMSFNAVKKGILDVTGREFKPEVLVADADPAIRNGYRAAFDDEALAVAMCYAHVIRNVSTKYAFNDSKKNKPQILDDLRALHNAYSQQIFEIGCELFVAKWEEAEPRVVDLINKSFFKQNNTWYIGFRFGTPVTDNALENFNGDIKTYQTDREKKPLKQFLKIALKMIRQRSKEYISVPKPRFQHEIEIPDEILISGAKFDRSHTYKLRRQEGCLEFYMFSSVEHEIVGRDITAKDVDDFKAATYNTFDEFKSNAFKIWCTTFPTNHDKWLQKTTCTCPAYDKTYVCKHIVFLAILYKMPDLPEIPTEEEPNYDDLPLLPAKTKKKGRPKKAGPSLQID